MEPRLMEIDWVDSSWSTGTFGMKEMEEFSLVHMTTVGYGIEKDDRYILAKEKSGIDDYRHLSSIPKVNITKVRTIRRK